jgi:predicted CoA-binding protein
MKRKTTKVFEMAGGLNTSMVYAIYTNADRLLKHKHAWKVWHTLKDFGCRVYVIAPDMDNFEGSKIYADFAALKDKVDVIIPCLRLEWLDDLVTNSAMIGVKFIWFQENNWSSDLDIQCREKKIEVVCGCVLKHKVYKKPFAIFNPCYWHGWKENKVPSKF